MERPASGGLPRPLPHDPDGERIDPYGFERAHDYESYKEMMNEYVAVLNRRSLRWSKLLQESPHIEKNLTVKRYVRKGVPSEHRSRIWMAASGAQEQLESRPGYYRSLLAARHQAPLTETIHADIHRTFPDNILFKSEASLQSSLFNVLVAYGHHNEAVGYCQVKTTATSSNYYSPSMLGLKADVEVLSELVKMKSPAVGQLMAQYPGIWMLVVSRWFICLYVDVLPIETVLRVWDCLFYEGSKVLFRVALTLIMHHQPEILRARSLPDVCQCFRQITCGAFSLECHSFMQRIFTEPGSLSMTTVQKLREKCTKQIQEEESGRS
ncbi:growth hormone-regulated TBC protein 1-A-like isoform X2 [Takifugu flavidus]|uniref:growth hormone-regulated TBC protein 1-A-like isoform X2 n=1 Tax=Takifugu flavidus TaxID=433684 RepID=UPI0025440AE2|nr:growth hormone-regulated TBC protein 1-A-like isoform X2 [Takifugu flavidus]